MKPIQIHPLSALLGAGALGLTLALTGMTQQVSNPTPVPDGQPVKPPPPELKELLSHISIVYLDDGRGGKAKTIRFTGVNVQIVNGLGATNGYPQDPASIGEAFTHTNGVGNLILGYNEPAGTANRTGSHNLISGNAQEYSSFGGILGGYDNSVTAPYSTASGGQGNQVEAAFASVSGGYQNDVRGQHCAINGGQLNLIGTGVTRATINAGVYNRILPYSLFTAESSSICGGGGNTIVGATASVLVGGDNNTCEYASSAVVVGGSANMSSSYGSVVVGGSSNVISENAGSGFDGEGSVIVGGIQNRAEGWNTVVVGGTSNYIDRYASASVIDGGRANSILGSTATNCVVGGGFLRLANSADDWRAGDLYQDQ